MDREKRQDARPQADSHPAHVNRGAHHYPDRGTAKACAPLGAAFPQISLRWGSRILWAFLNRRLSATENARLIRGMIEELGGLWVKAGQLLSLRIDMFSREFCRELSKLQYRPEGFPTAVGRKIIEEDLGAPIEVAFRLF